MIIPNIFNLENLTGGEIKTIAIYTNGKKIINIRYCVDGAAHVDEKSTRALTKDEMVLIRKRVVGAVIMIVAGPFLHGRYVIIDKEGCDKPTWELIYLPLDTVSVVAKNFEIFNQPISDFSEVFSIVNL